MFAFVLFLSSRLKRWGIQSIAGCSYELPEEDWYTKAVGMKRIILVVGAIELTDKVKRGLSASRSPAQAVSLRPAAGNLTNGFQQWT